MSQHVRPPRKIRDHIWQFTEGDEPYLDVNAYLIVGEKSALLVDALQSETGLLDEIRTITDKPLEVFITHGHRDHAGDAVRELHDAGVPIYMSHRDYGLLKGMADYGLQRDWLTDLKPGHVFDLGGFRFEILPVEGHSQGSMASPQPVPGAADRAVCEGYAVYHEQSAGRCPERGGRRYAVAERRIEVLPDQPRPDG